MKTGMVREGFVAGLLLAVAVLLPLPALGEGNGKTANVPACLFAVRDGMPNLAAKLEAGKKVEIVFLGGSITVMGGYTSVGYVRYVEHWLKERYPRAEIKVHNAGVPGTGSEYGAKRYDRDVLRHRPDAVFIEFAVNDGKSDQTVSMERMVHKSWLKDPRIDLVFFYTLDKSHLESYRKGNLPFAAGCHERVAERYGIPTIGTAFHAAEKVNSGLIEWKAFSGDTCHPSALGFRLFDEAFAAALPKLLQSKSDGLPHKLGQPITANLEVYPPVLKAKPLVSPKTFHFAEGDGPAAVYDLPIPAEHWVGEAIYRSPEGKALWKIKCLPRRFAGKLDGSAGLDRSLWKGNDAEWFEEGRSFSGTDGMPVFSGYGKSGSLLGVSGSSVGVLSFTAPERGIYEFRVCSGAFQMWANEGSTVVFSALKFTGKGDQGKVLAVHREVRKERRGISMSFSVELERGDEIAFLADMKLPEYIRGGWSHLKITGARKLPSQEF